MKRLLFSLLAIWLLSTPINAQNFKKGAIIESKDETSCSSFNQIEFAIKGLQECTTNGKFNIYMYQGWMSNANCKSITEGMDLKVIKSKVFTSNYGTNYSQGILVKLPTGMTTWIAR